MGTNSFRVPHMLNIWGDPYPFSLEALVMLYLIAIVERNFKLND